MANNNPHGDYLESLFKGIDIILEKRLDEVSFDTTVICTITDASNSKNGEYRVTDGSVSYKAYSDVDSYVAGQQVRVSVPMGDFSQKKFIVGKYVTDNDSTPITYVSPLNSVVNMSGNLVPLDQSAGLKANGDLKNVVIWNQSMAESACADLQANGIYNTIILKADFKTLLSNYDLISGTYGLRLDLLVRPSVSSTGRIRRYIELSSKEMFGNPYAFSIFSTQAKTFSISTIGIIEGIELSLYQNGDFKDRSIGVIPVNTITNDIIVSNIELGFGSDIVDVEDNIVKIYTENDIHYKYHNPSDDTNVKKIGLLWYNKDENNNYLGFSDGVYASNYDELTYLQASKMDTRLLAQRGREGIPTDRDSLNLAANIEEAVPLIHKAINVANQDLFKVLNNFRSQVSKIDTLCEHIDKLVLGSGSAYIGTYTQNISTALSDIEAGSCGLIQQYAGILDYARDTQMEVEEDRHSEWLPLWEDKYYEIIVNNFANICISVQTMLDAIKEQVSEPGAPYAGYKSIYDVYSIRILRTLDTMNEYLGIAIDENGELSKYNKDFPAGVLDGTDYNLLQSYRTRTEFKSYKEQDFSADANKYCIYWYRYEKDYVAPPEETLMPNGWRRLTAEEIGGTNVGLSGEDPELVIEGKTHHLKVPAAGTGFFTFNMQHDLETEKFVAIVFYNHNMYKSNELVFMNSDVIPDKTTLDKGDILIFEHLERSSDNFQLYTELGRLMDAADEQYSRNLRCHYDGLLAKDEALVGAGIYWYVPLNSTLLTYDRSYLENRGFVTDEDYILTDDEEKKAQRPDYSKDGYVCFYKQVAAQKMCSGCNKVFSECSCIEKTAEPYWDYTNGGNVDHRDFWYKIKPYYDENATQNTLLCQVKISEDDDPVNGEQLFTFGVAGTNGTKYTLDVTNTSTMIATTGSDGVALNVVLKNALNEPMPLYTSDYDGTINPGDAYNCKVNWYFHRGSNNPLTLMPEGGSEATGIMVGANQFGIIEVTADFAMPTGEEEAIDENHQPLKSREVSLDCLHAIPFAANNYYISGPTQIVYNNYGTLDNTSMFDKPYRLFWERDQIDEDGELIFQAHQQVEGVSWDIQYYIKDGNTYVLLSEEDEAYDLYHKYMPMINNGGGLTPSTLYLENLDCFAVVRAKIGNDVVWEQPIIIVQNRYASSMLNSWDGNFAINKENGTIMSTMIGAGRKSKNNTFEGVLMGNIALGTESDIGFENASAPGFLDQANVGYSNQSGLGLYGFHDGSQSFGFSIDGSAFLGKAGAGRIIFNGNYGVIASANWFSGDPKFIEQYPERATEAGGVVGELEDKKGILKTSTAGMCIDLEHGHIDAYDFKLTGSRIHFNSHPEIYNDDPLVTGYLMRIGHDGCTRCDYAESWLTDDQLKELATPGYMTMDGNGNLTMRVNSLYLTEQLGGANLLDQTSPRKTIPQTKTHAGDEGHPIYEKENGSIVYAWDLSEWDAGADTTLTGFNEEPGRDEKDYGLKITGSNCSISQDVYKPTSAEKYTLSGWIITESSATDAKGKLTLDIVNMRATTVMDGTTYPGYEVTVADKSINNTNQNEVSFTSKWTYFEYTFIAPYRVGDELAATDLRVTFNMDCNCYLWHVKLEQGSIATTWCPSNRDAEMNVQNTKDQYDQYLAQDEIFNKLIKDPVTGQTMVGIWLLPAEDGAGSRKELYINATYMSTGILRSSNWNGTLTAKKVTDKDGNVLVDAYGRERYTYALTQATDPQGVYFNLDEGKLWAADFELVAGNTIYMNSNPADGQSYFKIGSGGYYLDYTASNALKIKVTNFDLEAGTGDTQIWFTSNTAKNPLKIGKNFTIDWSGNLTATGATISASKLVVTTEGQIGGWLIDGDSLYYGTKSAKTAVLSGKDGRIEMGSGAGAAGTHFKVDASGKMTAVAAELSTLTVTESLSVAKGTGDGTVTMEGDVTIGGHLTLDAQHWIYLSDLKTGGARLNATGGKQLVLTAVTGMWLKAEGQSYDGSSLTGNYGIYLQATGAINLKSSTIAIGSSTSDLTSSTTIYGKLNVKADTTFESPENIVMKVDGGSQTLPEYIKDNGGALINLGSNDVSYAQKARYIATSKKDSDLVSLGSSTKPVYLSNGEFKECSSYPTVTTYTQGSNISISSGVIAVTTSSSNRIGYATYASNASKASVAKNNARGYAVTADGDGGYSTLGQTPYSTITGSSSRRFKHDIGKYPLDIEAFYQLKPTSFVFNQEMHQGSEVRYGFIAEDVNEFASQLVAKNEEDNSLCDAIHYNSILTLAVAEIQKLRKELDDIKSKL